MAYPKTTSRQKKEDAISASAKRRNCPAAKKKPPGKLTPSVFKEVVEKMSFGTPRSTVAKLLGISHRLFNMWLSHGARDMLINELRAGVKANEISTDDAEVMLTGLGISGNEASDFINGRKDTRHPIYAEFAEEVGRAEAGFEFECLKQIAGSKDTERWTRYAWLLDRLHPDKYAQVNKNMSGRDEEVAPAALARVSAMVAMLIGGTGKPKSASDNPPAVVTELPPTPSKH